MSTRARDASGASRDEAAMGAVARQSAAKMGADRRVDVLAGEVREGRERDARARTSRAR